MSILEGVPTEARPVPVVCDGHRAMDAGVRSRVAVAVSAAWQALSTNIGMNAGGEKSKTELRRTVHIVSASVGYRPASRSITFWTSASASSGV